MKARIHNLYCIFICSVAILTRIRHMHIPLLCQTRIVRTFITVQHFPGYPADQRDSLIKPGVLNESTRIWKLTFFTASDGFMISACSAGLNGTRLCRRQRVISSSLQATQFFRKGDYLKFWLGTSYSSGFRFQIRRYQTPDSARKQGEHNYTRCR